MNMNMTAPVKGSDAPTPWTVDIAGAEVDAAYVAICGYILFSVSLVALLWVFCRRQLNLDRLKHAGLRDDADDVFELDDAQV